MQARVLVNIRLPIRKKRVNLHLREYIVSVQISLQNMKIGTCVSWSIKPDVHNLLNKIYIIYRKSPITLKRNHNRMTDYF